MHTSITHKPHHQNKPAAEGKRLTEAVVTQEFQQQEHY